MADTTDLIPITADIVAAYVSNNRISMADLPALMASIYTSLNRAASGAELKAPEEKKGPATSVRKSLTPAFLVCMDCGKHQKSLKRHLRSAHDLTPDGYRAKWDLAHSYPMVAPDYAAARSALAKSMGLGLKVAPKGGATVPAAKATAKPKHAKKARAS